jgi:NADPH2:quinone reductase
MLAIMCRQFGTPDVLVAEQQPSPRAGRGEVVMRVRAVALSMANVLVIANNHPHPRQLPFSPGAEAAGEVKEVGEGVTGLKVGDLVMGQGVNGNCAEEIVCTASQLRPLPTGTDLTLAVAAAGSYATALYGLRGRARLQAGEWVVVLGAAGGVGLAAVELAKLMGAKVIACASTDEKLALCKAHGADHLINYARDDLGTALRKLCDGAGREGVDVVVDPVGGPYALAAIRNMAWDSRFLSIGYPAGVPSVPLDWLLHNRISILGMSIRELQKRDPQAAGVIFQDVMAYLVGGKICPHLHERYPLADAARALNDLLHRRVMGKAVLTA